MDSQSHEQLLDSVKRDFALKVKDYLTTDEIEHVYDIVQENKLRLSEFDDFRDGNEMSEAFAMQSVPAIEFWHYIRDLKLQLPKYNTGQESTITVNNNNTKEETKSRGTDGIDDISMRDLESQKLQNNNDETHSDGAETARNQKEKHKKMKEEDEKQERKSVNTRHIGGKIGFNNLGNTCFLNSALQCLLHTPGLTDEFIDKLLRKKDFNKNNPNNKEKAINNDETPQDWRSRLKKGDFVLLDFKNGEIQRKCKIYTTWRDGTIRVSCKNKNGTTYYSQWLDRSNSRLHYSPPESKGFFNTACEYAHSTWNSYHLSKKEQFNTMYDAWLNIVETAHLDKDRFRSSIRPTKLHRLIQSRVPELGNYAQHDACQALMAVLKEIENDLPDKEQTSLMFKHNVDKSFYDEKYDESKIDDIIVSGVQETGVLNLNANLISKYFDGIQVTQNICMECGKHTRLFTPSRILEVPIVNNYARLSVFKFDELIKNYVCLLDRCMVASDCTAKLAKFYALRQNEPFICSKLDSESSLVFLSKNLKGYGKILKDTARLAALPDIRDTNVGLFTVENHFMSNKADIKTDIQVLCMQIVPESLKISKKLSTSLLMDCLVFEKNQIADGISTKYLCTYLAHVKLGFFAMCDVYDELLKSYQLVYFVNGKYVSNGSKDCHLPLNKSASSNVIICLWQFKENKLSDESYDSNFNNNTSNSNKSIINEMRWELFDETKGKSLSGMITRAKKIKDNLENRKFSLKPIMKGTNASMSLKDAEIANEFCPFSAQDCTAVLSGIGIRITVCDEYIALLQKKIERETTVMNTIEDRIDSLFEICGLTNKSTSVCVSNSQIKTVDDCIRIYEAEKFRDCQDYPCDCPNCGVSPILSIRKKIVKPPKILIIKFDRGMNYSSRKYSHDVKFDTNLQFAGKEYDLFAINCHSGASGYGHYTAYVKKLGTDDWMYCNDSSVSYLGYDLNNAQFIIYQRKD